MKQKDKIELKESTKSKITNVMYAAALVVGLVGVALLVNNVLLFKNTVTQYVAQGYPAATVINQLIPTQLLPGIFEPVAVYGGIALVLLGIAVVNKKVSKCLALLTKPEACSDDTEENILEESIVGEEEVTIPEQTETIEETEKTE